MMSALPFRHLWDVGGGYVPMILVIENGREANNPNREEIL